MGVGSLAGALVAGARGRVSPRAARRLQRRRSGLSPLLAALAPTLPLAAVALVLAGAASVTFAAGVNSTLQPRSSRRCAGA